MMKMKSSRPVKTPAMIWNIGVARPLTCLTTASSTPSPDATPLAASGHWPPTAR